MARIHKIDFQHGITKMDKSCINFQNISEIEFSQMKKRD